MNDRYSPKLRANGLPPSLGPAPSHQTDAADWRNDLARYMGCTGRARRTGRPVPFTEPCSESPDCRRPHWRNSLARYTGCTGRARRTDRPVPFTEPCSESPDCRRHHRNIDLACYEGCISRARRTEALSLSPILAPSRRTVAGRTGGIVLLATWDVPVGLDAPTALSPSLSPAPSPDCRRPHWRNSLARYTSCTGRVVLDAPTALSPSLSLAPSRRSVAVALSNLCT